MAKQTNTPQKNKNTLPLSQQNPPTSPPVIANNTTENKAQEPNKWLIIGSIIGITFLCLFTLLSADFTNWDDDLYVTENSWLNAFTWENIKTIFTSPLSANYNPLTIFTFLIEKTLFGLNPFWFHFNNIILHLICTGLVYNLMRLLKLQWQTAAVVALLFGIHPMHIESVAWVTERKDVLFGTFYIAALINYVKYTQNIDNETPQKSNKHYYVYIIIFAILALLSKIQAVSLPLTMLVIDYYLNRHKKHNWFSTLILKEKTVFFALSLIIGLIGVMFLGKANTLDLGVTSGSSFGITTRILFGFYTLCVYILKLFIPIQLAACYPYPNPQAVPITYYLSPILIIGIAFLTFLSTKKTKIAIFGTVFFFVNIVFMLQILGAGQAFLADRFTYIAYIGLFFIIAKTWEYFNNQTTYKQLSNIVLGIYLAAMALLSYQQATTWKNSETMWTNVLKYYPTVDVAYNNRGNFYREQKQPDKALADYNKAIETNPNYRLAYNGRGNIYFNNNQNERAIEDYNKVLSINANDAKALNNRAAALFKLNRIDEAIPDVEKAVALEPNYPDALLNRAVLYSVKELHDKALIDYTQFLKFKPQHAQAYNWRGIANRKLKNYDQALKDANQAIQLNNTVGDFFLNRAIIHLETGNKAAAQTDAAKAQGLGVNIPPDIAKLLLQ